MKNSHFLKIIFLFFISVLIINKGESQVLISASSGTPDNSAMLEIQSNNKGLLIPRMSTANRILLASTAVEGLLIFDSDEKSFYIFGNGKWTDLSKPAGIWETNSSDVFLSKSYTNVGIGTGSPTGKLVIKADASKGPDDALFEIQDSLGNPIFVVTSEGARVYVKDYPNSKGVSGGFAVGRYRAAKGIPDTTYFLVTPDSTRVYMHESKLKGVSGGFAVGRYPAAKDDAVMFFETNESQTRVYTNDEFKGVSGGFAVGRYRAAKGLDSLYFYTNQDSTRVYTKDLGKGISGGFAVGRYGAAKGVDSMFFFTNRDSTRVYVPEGGAAGEIGGFAVTGNNTGVTDDYFNVTGNLNVELINNKRKVMWYPQKSALLGGDVHVGSVDSVGENSVALGYRSISMGDWSQAFGYKSKALGTYSTAMGYEAESDTNSLAIGYSAKATGNDAFALGEASAEGNFSYAFGSPGKLSGGSPTERPKATGEYAYSFGSGTVSSGDGAFSIGVQDTSSGDYSMAIGYISNATNRGSVAIGSNLLSSGFYSFASGYYSVASGSRSVAMGYENTASGYASFAAGRYNAASGAYSTAFGRSDTASSLYSTVFGRENIVTGNYATSMGYKTTAQSYESLVIGENNIVAGSTNSWISTDPLFVAGNGYPTNPSNALTLYKNGVLNINDEFSFPNVDGSNGQVLQTNGSGTLSWVSSSTLYDNDWTVSGINMYSAVSGNVGIGTSSPAQKLDVNGHIRLTGGDRIIESISGFLDLRPHDATYGLILRNYTGTSTIWSNFRTIDATTDYLHIAMNSTSTAEGLVISDNAFVGIGTITPTQRLQVAGNVYSSSGDFYASSSNGVINCGGGILHASTNVIGDNITNMGYAAADDDLYIRMILEVDGAAYKPGGGSWATQSDKRFKKDIIEYTDGLDKIMQINPVFFRYNEKAGVSDLNKRYVGILAQDIKDILPYTVELTPFNKTEIEDENGNVAKIEWDGEEYYTFDASALNFLLINGIKEQQTQIEEQNIKIENLEKQIQELKDLINQ